MKGKSTKTIFRVFMPHRDFVHPPIVSKEGASYKLKEMIIFIGIQKKNNFVTDFGRLFFKMTVNADVVKGCKMNLSYRTLFRKDSNLQPVHLSSHSVSQKNAFQLVKSHCVSGCSGGEASPVADSACGSSADSSSCSSTPLSEGAPEGGLAAKVARLRRTRDTLDRRMAEARHEEAARRDDRLLLRRELAQFRRLLLLQTLAELRGQLEKKTREQTWK